MVRKSSQDDELDLDLERRLSLLRILAGNPALSQRQMSAELGLSVGKTNYVIRALLQRGLVKMRNFRRSDNKLAYAYVLTPSGLAEKMRLTGRFLVEKEREFDRLRATIDGLRAELKSDAPDLG
jgi:EPS-associated MarR family transcriptional regulator